MFFPHPHQPDFSLSALKGLNLNIEDSRVISSRVRVGRNLQDFSVPALISRDERQEALSTITKALNPVIAESGGQIYSVADLSDEENDAWIASHISFRETDRFPKVTGINRHWPQGRGFYCSEDRELVVWANEEDHLRIFSLLSGGNLGKAFERCVSGLKILEKNLSFTHHEKWGYLASCPTNIGTGMRISVHMNLQHLASANKLEPLCKELNLSIRGDQGESSISAGGIFDISNQQRSGVTEVKLLETVVRGVSVLVEEERNLS